MYYLRKSRQKKKKEIKKKKKKTIFIALLPSPVERKREGKGSEEKEERGRKGKPTPLCPLFPPFEKEEKARKEKGGGAFTLKERKKKRDGPPSCPHTLLELEEGGKLCEGRGGGKRVRGPGYLAFPLHRR